MQELLLVRRTLGDLTVEAADLDLTAFQLTMVEARLRGDGPQVPTELAAHDAQ